MDGWSVQVEKRKWDGSVSALARGRVLHDEPGRVAWVVPAGSLRSRPRKGLTELVRTPEAYVWAGGWWVASARPAPDGGVRHRVDACTPLVRPGPGRLRWIDLDLDLEQDAGHRMVTLLDRRDFARNAARMGYPALVRQGAWDGLHQAHALLAAGAWPFDGWLAGLLGAARRPAEVA